MKRYLVYFQAMAVLAGVLDGLGANGEMSIVKPYQEPTDVYLLIGQSNMAGRGAVTPDTAVSTERILKLTKDGAWVPATEPIHFDKSVAGAGLAASFARQMADADQAVTVGLVPCAVGGTPLAKWMPGTALYSNAIARVRRATAGGGRLKGVLWHQGEGDSEDPQLRATYAARLERMLTALRTELGAVDVPVVLGELKSFRSETDAAYAEINAALKAVAERLPRTALVSGADLAHKGDEVHYDTSSLRRFGRRYAEAMKRLQTKTGPLGKIVGTLRSRRCSSTRRRARFLLPRRPAAVPLREEDGMIFNKIAQNM